MPLLRHLDRLLAAVDTVLATLAAVAMLAIMLIVSSDVMMRYAFNRPWPWAYDLIDLYLTLALFYFTLTWTFRNNGHIRVDLLLDRVSLPVRRLAETAICLLAAGLFACIAAATFERMTGQLAGGDIIAGAVAWPTWLSTAFVPLGAGLLALRLLLNALAHAAALAGYGETVKLPPIVESARRSSEA
jgi:TRAP-type C4-dicarboxylate transport system permease small subunit